MLAVLDLDMNLSAMMGGAARVVSQSIAHAPRNNPAATVPRLTKSGPDTALAGRRLIAALDLQ
jgi:hypothetical protein